MSRSETSWSPTLARVELLIEPRPMSPEPKFVTPVAAKPIRTRMNSTATIPVPIFDLDKRRKKESIGIPGTETGGWAEALGASLAPIKARPLGARRTGVKHVVEEAGRRQLEDARALRGPGGGLGDRRGIEAVSRCGRCPVRSRDPDRTRGSGGPRLRGRRSGCPLRRKGRSHGQHFSADAARCRRGAHHRWSFRTS